MQPYLYTKHAVNKEQLFSLWSRRVGLDPPKVRLVDYGGHEKQEEEEEEEEEEKMLQDDGSNSGSDKMSGVYYGAGHPAWPLWTIDLDTHTALVINATESSSSRQEDEEGGAKEQL